MMERKNKIMNALNVIELQHKRKIIGQSFDNLLNILKEEKADEYILHTINNKINSENYLLELMEKSLGISWKKIFVLLLFQELNNEEIIPHNNKLIEKIIRIDKSIDSLTRSYHTNDPGGEINIHSLHEQIKILIAGLEYLP